MAATEQERILLALDACCDLSAATMDTVVTMAARMGAALEALFVEDAELLRAAELPFVREVAPGGERALSPERLRQMNRDLAADIARRLEEAARQSHVHWQYSVAEGSRLPKAFEAAERCDVFVPGRPARRPRAGAREGDAFRRVAVIYTGSAQAARALAVIRALADDGHTREILLVCQAPPPPEILAELAAARLRTFTQAASLADLRYTLSEVQSHAPGMLIAPKDVLVTSAAAGAIARALNALPMSLLLLR